MTVAELIIELQKYPPNVTVAVCSREWKAADDVTHIEHWHDDEYILLVGED